MWRKPPRRVWRQSHQVLKLTGIRDPYKQIWRIQENVTLSGGREKGIQSMIYNIYLLYVQHLKNESLKKRKSLLSLGSWFFFLYIVLYCPPLFLQWAWIPFTIKTSIILQSKQVLFAPALFVDLKGPLLVAERHKAVGCCLFEHTDGLLFLLTSSNPLLPWSYGGGPHLDHFLSLVET